MSERLIVCVREQVCVWSVVDWSVATLQLTPFLWFFHWLLACCSRFASLHLLRLRRKRFDVVSKKIRSNEPNLCAVAIFLHAQRSVLLSLRDAVLFPFSTFRSAKFYSYICVCAQCASAVSEHFMCK